MFKAPCCNIEIKWWKGILSRPMDPVKCPKCGSKYHDEAKRKYSKLNLWLIIFIIIFVLSGIVLDVQPLAYFGFFIMTVCLSLMVYDERLVIKAGVLTKTTRQKQKKDLRILFIGAAVIVFSVLYEIYQAL